MSVRSVALQDGFARFTQTRYSSEPRDVANTFMHLTNVVSGMTKPFRVEGRVVQERGSILIQGDACLLRCSAGHPEEERRL